MGTEFEQRDDLTQTHIWDASIFFPNFNKRLDKRYREFCVSKIVSSKEKITIHELEKKTGYSSRWLNIKFKDKLGISPQNLSTIICFNQYYNASGHCKRTIPTH